MSNVFCEYCGSEEFYLQFSDIHIKAICCRCGKPFKTGSYTHFINYIDKENKNNELATDKQIKYIRFMSYHNTDKLTREDAGDIIGIFEHAKKD